MNDNSAMLPLGILLLGVAALAGFMAFRLHPWPMPGGSPIEPGAYAIQILQGKPPAASEPPDRQADIAVIEGGLMALVVIWAAGKIAGLISGLGGGGGGGSEDEEGEGEGEAEGEAGAEGEGGGFLGDIGDVVGDVGDVL